MGLKMWYTMVYPQMISLLGNMMINHQIRDNPIHIFRHSRIIIDIQPTAHWIGKRPTESLEEPTQKPWWCNWYECGRRLCMTKDPSEKKHISKDLCRVIDILCIYIIIYIYIFIYRLVYLYIYTYFDIYHIS